MFRSILIPLDGSKLSEASLQPAAVLAAKLGASVTLLHVVEQDAPTEIHKERHLTEAGEAELYLKEAARAFPATVRVKMHVHAAAVSDVAQSIVAHATAEFRADLIVTCTHGRGGVQGLLFGSIAQQIVAQGTTPLMLIRPGSPTFKLERILVPLDPDSGHDDSLAPAEQLARSFGAVLTLLSVIPTYSNLTGEQAATSSLMPATTQAMLDLQEEQAADHLRIHQDDLRRAAVTCSTAVARGDPSGVILRVSESADMDLIILSTHRKAGLSAFWARSVAPKVVQGTKRPVLLIPLE